jgi:hypothetical protein
MSERTGEQVARGPVDGPVDGSGGEQPEPGRARLPGGMVLALLVLDGVLLGAFGLMFTPLYANGIPVPMGAVLSLLVLPWLVTRAGEIDPRPALAGAPLTAWVLTVAVLVLFGPGGDEMLIVDWPALVLVAALLAGLWALRGVIERGYRSSRG